VLCNLSRFFCNTQLKSPATIEEQHFLKFLYKIQGKCMITCAGGMYSKINKGKGETISDIIGSSKSSIFIGKCLTCFRNQSTSNQNSCSTYFWEN